MKNNCPKVLAVQCDPQGGIQKVVLDYSGFRDAANGRANLFSMANTDERYQLKSLFRNAEEKGFALLFNSPRFLRDLNLEYLAAIAHESSVFCLASGAQDQLFALCSMVMGSRFQESMLPPMDAPLEHSQLPASTDHGVALDDFMRVNNELINSKRELIKSNQRLLEQEQRFIGIIQENPDPVFILDASGTVRFLSNAALAMTREAFPLKPIKDEPLPFAPNENGEVFVESPSAYLKVYDFLEVKTSWEDKPATLVALRDITGRKTAEASLKELCNDLESRVQQRTSSLNRTNELLTEEVAKRKDTEEALRRSEELFRRTFSLAPMGAALVSHDFGFIQTNAELARITGYESQELVAKLFPDIFHPGDLEEHHVQLQQLSDGAVDHYAQELRVVRKDGSHTWVQLLTGKIPGSKDAPHYYLPMMVDIHERKQLSEELVATNKGLLVKTNELEEMNAALRVLLDQRERDREVFQNQVTANMEMLILPYLEVIEQNPRAPNVDMHLQTIRRNFEDITSAFSRSLRTEYQNLTTNEIKVADLIRSGMSSKDIAAMRNVSVRTVEYYRKRIRSKLGLLGKKINLQAYLAELAKPM